MDYLVKLPSSWRYINQFIHTHWSEDPSTMRCGPDSSALAAEFAYPGRWDPVELMHDLYVKWAGADISSNKQGTTIEEIKNWLASVHIGFIDLQLLVDEHNKGNRDPLRHMLGWMNKQNVPQIVTVTDEAYMRKAVLDAQHEYVSGPILHSWTNPDDPHHTVYSHVIFRVGFSDSDGIGYYADPAAPNFCLDSKGNFTPVPILWSDMEKAGIMHALAIMPHGVSVPPEGLNFNWANTPWPTPPPKIDLDRAAQAVHGLDAPLQALKNMADAMDSGHLHTVVSALEASQKSILADIGKE